MFKLFNQYGNIPFDYQKIINDVLRGIKELEHYQKDVSVNLIFVNDEQILNINQQYRNINDTTDVISFESFDEEDLTYIGDIFINIDRVKLQANKYNHSIEREFAFLLCHGVLHLLGYDHLIKVDEEEMFSMQEKILNFINYRR